MVIRKGTVFWSFIFSRFSTSSPLSSPAARGVHDPDFMVSSFVDTVCRFTVGYCIIAAL